MFIRKNEYELLNQMLDDAIAGEFEEKTFDESELSKLQTKLKRYLTTSSISKKKISEEKSQLKELITNISHQTKTPLTNIMLYAELLEEQVMEESTREYAKEIVTHANKLKHLIQALVKMSRLETGVFQFDPKKQLISEVLEEIVDIGKRKADEKKIKIVLSKPNKEAAVFDKKWAIEAVYNILDNAIKYSDEGTSIFVSAFQHEMFAGIRIKDEGIGMEEDDIPRIFGRFFRGKDVHDKEGIGIGLYLAREIIEGQDGYIKVSSKPGDGSTFDIFFPTE
jgi:signal transduction histidine kinase